MRKRFLSLLCVLALCLGLLPVTALAADGGTVYVGGVMLSGSTDSPAYATTDDNGTVTIVDASTDNYNIMWDGSTLTLDGAKIKGATSSESLYATAGIYAFSNSGDVSLNIALQDVNEIFDSSHGIWVYSSSTGAATLTITGDGSLTASGSSSGILVQSNDGDATLTIQNADVTAENSISSGDGVTVRAGSSSSASLSVDGGSLTATGTGVGSGINFLFGSWVSGSEMPSLTVSGNTIVRANGGISDNSSTDIQIGEGQNSSGGIVFDGNEGTVYGSVTLQDDLEIKSGETLTVPDGSSLNCNGNLTNNGTINVESGGNLEGEPTSGTGTVVSAPKITTESLASGTVGAAYSQALQADNAPTLWSITSGSLPDGLNLSGSTISGTPTTAGTSTFTVKAENSAGSDSKEYTLTIQSATVPVTGVKLNTETLELFTSNTATLTATVQPGNATNKNVTWSSNNAEVATVEGGTVTAVGAGETTITVQTQDGNHTATCTVKVTQSAYSISADTTALNFGSVYTGYAQPAAKTVTITNTGNRPQPLTLTASTGSFEVGTLTKTQLAAGEKATFTVQPKAGLAVGTYSENITVSGTGGATVTITASFTVEQRDNTPYYGITVNDLANGTVTCYAKSAAKGAEVTLTVKPDVGYALDKLTVTDASGKTVDVTKVDEKTYTFVMPGSKVTVEAVFAPSTSGLPFTDVSAGDWFYGAVKFVYENGLMDGVAGNLFAPNATLNRAMAVTILYRLEGSPDLDGENLGYPFADVDGNAWYGDAVYWARCNGIVDGVENNHFDPTGSLTREQMATVLYRYAQYKGADVSASGDLSGFADSANVSAWAVDAVKWAVGSGLVNGVEGNALAPQGTSTRAQTAAILARFCGSVI